jgi:BASS family bile acid:Na+ symporter
MVNGVVRFVLSNAVALFMLAVGLETDLDAVARGWRERRRFLFLRALAAVVLGVPLLALAVVVAFPMPPVARGAILLLAVCPGRPQFLSSAGRAGASAPTALTTLLLLAVIGPLTVPAWLWVLGRVYRVDLAVSPRLVIEIVASAVLVPFALGNLVSRYAPGFAARTAKWVRLLASLALLASSIVAVMAGASRLLELFPGAAAALLVLTMGSAILGHWAGAPRLADSKAFAFAAVSGDPTLVLAIAARGFPDLRAEGVVIACLVVRALALVPYQGWLRASEPRAAPQRGAP